MKISDDIYTGFYLQPNCEMALKKFDNPKYDEIKEKMDGFYLEDAEIFLKGLCHVFAYALNQEFKYDIYELYDENNRYVHTFCMSKCDGIDLFIDVRGITSSEKCFAKTFNVSASNRKKINNIEKDKDFNKYSIQFANDIINRNFGFYIDKIAKE